MLILTRRTNETLMIGDDIKITVLNVKGNQVRIGIDAPNDIAVHREEIYERIQNEQEGNKKVNKYKERYERAIKKPSLN